MVTHSSLSFISPRPKPLFAKDTKFWMLLILSTFFILGTLSGALLWKISGIKHEIKTTIEERKEFAIKATEAKDEYEVLKEDVAFAKTGQVANQMLIASVSNLFEIIPDAITLHKIELTDQCLTLIGTAPTKELYNLQLSPALKSVFAKSEVSFIPRGPGKVEFISINSIAGENNGR